MYICFTAGSVKWVWHLTEPCSAVTVHIYYSKQQQTWNSVNSDSIYRKPELFEVMKTSPVQLLDQFSDSQFKQKLKPRHYCLGDYTKWEMCSPPQTLHGRRFHTAPQPVFFTDHPVFQLNDSITYPLHPEWITLAQHACKNLSHSHLTSLQKLRPAPFHPSLPTLLQHTVLDSSRHSQLYGTLQFLSVLIRAPYFQVEHPIVFLINE